MAAHLAARANSLLAGGDVAGYAALFQAATEHPDVQRRYHARTLLLQEGLDGAGKLRSAAKTTLLFVAIARAALDALQEEPREPVLLNYAGVALYELWSLDAAGALFAAAERLAPSLPFLERNIAELRRRRRAAGRRAARPMHPAVSGLATRGKRLARLAQPVQGLKLSLCMIVRDEEAMLGRCLDSVASAVDEIVVVDTGSTDRTIEIARSFGARVIEHEWTGSFSEARNISFDAAMGDWLMFLDADEVLVDEDVSQLRALTSHTWREAFYLVERNHVGETEEGMAVAHNALRIFRNRPEYRFEGRIHEQIAHRLPTFARERIEMTGIRLEHYGYLGAVRDAKEKSRRNIELLRAQLEESGSTAFLHYNLGSEYGAAGEPEAAVTEFELALRLIELTGREGATRAFLPSLLLRHVQALRASGRPEDALEAAAEGLAEFPDFTDLVLEQAWAKRSLGHEDEALALYERCLEMGESPAGYMPTVGCGTYLPKVAIGEIYLDRGEPERARELFERAIDEHPVFGAAVVPYAAALLRSGVPAESVATEIERRMPQLTPSVRFVLATGLVRRGALEAAEQQYRRVLESRPHSAQARVALAESLLHQRRYVDAAAEASQVPADDPYAALSSRIELWGLVAGGALDEVGAAVARARDAGVPAAELEVFTAWSALAAGTPEPPVLPIAATPLLGVILETELRIHDFQTFETLLALFERSALPQREQRELLGSIYLRYGFLPFAAKQWMAVCEEQPDARAMLGLAQVAVADGQRQSAAAFAAEALRLDPDSAAASELLTATG